jgi:hypothetical protein
VELESCLFMEGLGQICDACFSGNEECGAIRAGLSSCGDFLATQARDGCLNMSHSIDIFGSCWHAWVGGMRKESVSASRNLPLSLVVVVCFLVNFTSYGQSTAAGATAQSSQLTAEQDHQRTMELLGISTLRPGVNNDAKSPHAANYDETKANPYPTLPALLVLNDGAKVTTAKMWWSQRRPQILEAFEREVYGRVPKNVPSVTWAVESTAKAMNGDVPVIVRKLIGHVDNSMDPAIKVDIRVTLGTPANAKGPVPVVMEFTWDKYPFPAGWAQPAAPPGPTWQQQALAKGWGYADFYPISVQADNGAGLTAGIIGLVNKGQPRKLDDWGALRAWAWGASRVLDFMEGDKAVDAHHVAIAGHSRFGKAALLAMATDPRFAVVYVSSSGTGGAQLWRRNFGERLENVAATGEYHWMAGNFLTYAGPKTAADMPVDQHELIAFCAPRPVFIGAGATDGDGWADGMGMFKAEVAAGPVYTLLGKKGLGMSELPPIGTPLVTGELGFLQHSGGHTPAPNWPTFLNFAARYLDVSPM